MENPKNTDIYHITAYSLSVFSFCITFSLASSINEKIFILYLAIYIFLSVSLVVCTIIYLFLLFKQIEWKPTFINKYIIIASISFILAIFYQ
jgi:hypothetical protein